MQKCIQCKKFVQIFSCHGCQQVFCNEHIIEHREELSNKMENINKEYSHFEENLNEKDIIQTHLSRIDQWEYDSINKIQKTAEIARNNLLENLNQLKTSVSKINQDIQLNRESKIFTETNLNQWIEQLKQLRQIYKTSFTDENHSSIPLIKIIEKKQLPSLSREKFDRIVGKISLSKDCLTAICLKTNWNGSTISGKNLYSTGVHSIRFRINKKGKNNLFFGITSTAKDTNPWNRKTPSAYGWWEFPLNIDEQENPIDQKILENDEVTLTLDCSNNQIQFEHHRTNRYIDESITHERCPFPWKIAVVLYSPGDSVSIL